MADDYNTNLLFQRAALASHLFTPVYLNFVANKSFADRDKISGKAFSSL
jgi:hypothetical protein